MRHTRDIEGPERALLHCARALRGQILPSRGFGLALGDLRPVSLPLALSCRSLKAIPSVMPEKTQSLRSEPDQAHLDAELIRMTRNKDALAVAALLAEGASALAYDESTGEDQIKNHDALCIAASQGDIECVKILLPHSDCKRPMEYGSALHNAAYGGHAECVQFLLPHCDPNARDAIGHTPLMDAAAERHLDCVKLLLPVSAVDAVVPFADGRMDSGRNALMIALELADADSVEIIEVLAPVTKNLSIVDDFMQTVLTLATQRGKDFNEPRFLAPFLSRLDPNARSKGSGLTPMEVAGLADWPEGVKMWLPMTNVRAIHQGLTAIDRMVFAGRWKIADLLSEHSHKNRAQTALVVAGPQRMPMHAARVEAEALRKVVEKAGKAKISAKGKSAESTESAQNARLTVPGARNGRKPLAL